MKDGSFMGLLKKIDQWCFGGNILMTVWLTFLFLVIGQRYAASGDEPLVQTIEKVKPSIVGVGTVQ